MAFALTSRKILPKLLFLALLAAFFATPLPMHPPLFQVREMLPFDAAPMSPSASQIRIYDFRLTRSRPDITVHFSSQLSSGRVEFTLADGKSSAVWGLRGRDSAESTFSFGHDFQPGAYKLKVESWDARGTFRAGVLAARPWQYHQKLYVVLAVGLAVLAVRMFIARRKEGSVAPASRKHAAMAYVLGFGLVLALLYPIIHETGHALPMIAFGAFSLRGSDFIGAWGHPHVEYLPGVKLEPWQYCIIALGGPLLPSVVGWLLFVLWAAVRPRRTMSFGLEAGLLWTSAVMMVGQAGTLIPMLGLASDGDYSGFVQNLAAPLWVANAVHLGLLAINCVLIYHIVRRLLEIGRAVAARKREVPVEPGPSPAVG